MIDLCSFNKSLKTTWVKKYLDMTNHGKWRFLFDLELENFVDQVSSDITFQEQFLWFNSLIRIDNKAHKFS